MNISLFIPRGLSFVLLCSIAVLPGRAQSFKTGYPDIPRIDPHIHVKERSRAGFQAYLDVRDSVKSILDADVVLWINLSANNADSARIYSLGRMLNAMRSTETEIDFSTKEQFDSLKRAGYIGYKIWYGPPSRRKDTRRPYIDDPANDAAFSVIEKEGVTLFSLHLADPNGPFEWRTPWAADPVEYWRQIIGFERVLSRHPDMKVIAAHGAWLMTQGAQLDFLRYLMDTYPNFNVDISATMEYSNLQSYDNLRDFYISYQDRLVWASDMSDVTTERSFQRMLDFYRYWFRFLETTDTFGEEISSNGKSLKGLGLPREVLEKLYYKNVLRIYPREVEAAFNSLQ